MAKTKEKKSKDVVMGGTATEEVDSYDTKAAHVIAIAKPLAPKKLNKKVLKTVKKAAKQKHIKRGVKEVVKALRKKESSADKALVVIAGDISPIDVISHIPVLCEDHGIKYVFTPGKEELGAAGGTKRPTSVIMVQLGGKAKDGKEGDYKEAFEEILKELENES